MTLVREIEPVTAAEFLRFLTCWQHVDPEHRREGPRGVAEVIAQLAGFTKASFDECLKNEKVANGIIAVRDKAENEFGVTGIPTFFINGKVLNGEASIAEFKKIIDPQLT